MWSFAETQNKVFRFFSQFITKGSFPSLGQRCCLYKDAASFKSKKALGSPQFPWAPDPKVLRSSFPEALLLSSTATCCQKLFRKCCKSTPKPCVVDFYLPWNGGGFLLAAFPWPFFKSVSTKTWLNLGLTFHPCFYSSGASCCQWDEVETLQDGDQALSSVALVQSIHLVPSFFSFPLRFTELILLFCVTLTLTH